MKRRGGPASFETSKDGKDSKRHKSGDNASKSHSSKSNSSQGGSKSKKERSRLLDEEIEHEMIGGDNFFMDDDKPSNNPRSSKMAIDSDEDSVSENADEKRLRQGKEYLQKILESSKKDSRESSDENESSDESGDEDKINSKLYEDALQSTGRMSVRKSSSIFKNLNLKDVEIRFLRGHQLAITAVRISDDENTLYTASKDCNIIKWDVSTGKKIAVYKGKRNDNNVVGHSHHILALALSSDGKFLASGGCDKQILVWDTEKNDVRDGFAGHRDIITALTFRLGSHDLYSGSDDRTIKIWNVDEMGYVDTLFGHKAPVSAIDCLARERAVSSSHDKTVAVWKIPEEVHLEFLGPKTPLDSIAMLTEDLFVSGGQDGSIQLWSTQKRKPLHERKLTHGAQTSDSINWITALAGLRYSDMFASGSGTGDIILWKLNEAKDSFETILTIPMPGIINSLQFSKSGRYLIAGIGQEPRLGRWVRLSGVKNATAIIKLH